MLYMKETDLLLKFLKYGKKNIISKNNLNINGKCPNMQSFCTYLLDSKNIMRNTFMDKGMSTFSNKSSYLIIKDIGKYFFTTTSRVHFNMTTKDISNNSVTRAYSKDVSIFENPNVIILFDKNRRETIGERIYRYLDITGFLTRYNNRKEWLLDLDPYTRLSTVMLTEYERKLMIFLKFHVYLLFVICMYLWYHAQVHFSMKPPCPKPVAYGHMDGRKRDFTWHGKLFFIYPKMRCKECRWLDIQCKKECFEKLKLEGHKFIINNGDPLSVPKTVLYPSHFR
ncbi:hypothetical protein PFLG_02234 [Plasmodium falciparum RAJ116]|uniref:Uncharacterized protein n=1 Tax=Plasmodium falciparum RAJ116 TaxID=580058 RepID=A0A0L0D055_PLAFA|nr:hypothetical protein PFLG_02234 [Plasmodium falciparum RAJ116]